MNKEEFNNLWKDSTKEQILNQYYYDYEEMIKSHNIIKEVREYIEHNLIHDTVEHCRKAIIVPEELLQILDKENE